MEDDNARQGPAALTAGLVMLDAVVKGRRKTADLPPSAVTHLRWTLGRVRQLMQTDPHVGPMLEGAQNRLEDALAVGDFGPISPSDVRTIQRFAEPTPVRRSRGGPK